MDNRKKILKHVYNMEAYAASMQQEASRIRAMLGEVSTSPARKGSRSKAIQKVLANREKTLLKRGATQGHEKAAR